MRSYKVILYMVILASIISTSGCGPTGNKPKDAVPTPVVRVADPASELREIAEKGKVKLPSAVRKGYTFADVRVETIATASIVYPYAGRIIADYTEDSSGYIDRCVIYFKYDANKWVFAKIERGGGGGAFPGTLTEDRGLLPADIPEGNRRPTAPFFSIWIP